ncbi:phosphate acyltransferase PlsX [Conexibacter sp. SYSU D00693]|uniref:phosphate acyltransferase PlsX n=1 Tax=Conexibacter sp. SYSU D00693 TaxID=2812560 RepID=UPI00196B8C17|nr:phosphate acyltransferase PlsX [Conexibacter sp. SYSU D00693]
MTVTVAVDANGADLGPAEVAHGAVLAARTGVRVVLFGPAAELAPVVAGEDAIRVVDAPVSIAKAPDPAAAVRGHPESSIVRAWAAVKDGEAQTVVSGGSTGAALAAGLFGIRRARGISRPALALPVPVPANPVTLVDVGANTEVRAEQLVQFAFMGAALASAVLGVERPRVALLSNGEEPTKGTPTVVEAHEALAARAKDSVALEFVGNVEGTSLMTGAADVVVADGFTGNVALKTMEGTSKVLLEAIRGAATSSARAKAGGLLLRGALGDLRADLDPEAVGGAYLLGLRSLGVVPHGRFTRAGFSQAIQLAARGVREDVVGRTHEALEAAGALRRSGASEPASTVS